MNIRHIDPTRQYLFDGSESDPQKVLADINQFVACSYNPESFTFSGGECLDLVIDIIRLPGENASDEECLEMINTIIGAWQSINPR